MFNYLRRAKTKTGNYHVSLFDQLKPEIAKELDAVYGDLSPSMITVRYWFNEFKRGCTSVFDEEHPGRLADMITAGIVKKVHDMILAD